MFKFFKKIQKKGISGSGLNVILGNALEPESGNRYERWVYACITTIAKSIADIDLELSQMNKKEVNKIESHELLSLMYKPNPKMTKFDLWYLTFIYFLKDGEVAWILDKQEGRVKPKYIYPYPTSFLQVVKEDEEGEPAMYELRVGNKRSYVPADLVKIFRNPDPANPKKGKSIMSAMIDVIDNDTRMVKWNRSVLVNSARPSGVLEVQGTVDRKTSKMLQEQFKEAYSGYNNAGNVAILGKGTKYNAFGLAPKDIEYIEGRKMNRDEILAIFGVPKILLGLETGYNRATAETAERMFNKNTLQPLMTMVVEQINMSITPLFGNSLWLDFQYLDTRDREQVLAEQTAGWNKWLTTNEIREQNGLAPIQGGDMLYMPLNLMPSMGGEIKELKAERSRDYNYKQEQRIRGKIKVRDYFLEKRNENLTDSIIKKLEGKKIVLKVDKKKSLLEQNEKTRQEIEKLFIKKLENLFESQKQKVLENLDLKEKSLKADPFDIDSELKTTLSIIEPTYYEAMKKGALLASEIAGTEFVDITTLPESVKWIKAVSEKYSKEIVDFTYERTKDVIQQGITDGVGPDVLAKNISELYDQMSENRSRVIARTESARSLTAGQSREWAEAGIEKFEWLTAGDENVSAICQDNSTKTWNAKQAEQGTVEHSHPNCRCMFLPI